MEGRAGLTKARVARKSRLIATVSRRSLAPVGQANA